MYYPGFRSCETCVKWQHDDEPRKDDWGGVKRRNGEPVPRLNPSSTPCWACPKTRGESEQTPAVGRKSELSPRNRKTLNLYNESKACGGIEGADELLRRNLGVIEQLYRSYDRWQLKRQIKLLERM